MNTPNQPNILFLLHLPPPVHGAAMACNYIKGSRYINSRINATYINLAMNTRLTESGRAGFKKISKFYSLVKQLLNTLKMKDFDLCHISIAASGPGFYKDLVLIYILKKKGVKIIYHFHNKGVKAASKNSINRSAYRYAFKGTKSILLSSYLYPDISDYVDEKNIYYCPYGIPDNTTNERREESNFKNERICNFLFLSNMIKEKGVYTFLEAIKLLKNEYDNFQCHFVGGWSDVTPENFENFVETNGLSHQVFAHGPKYNNEKNAFFEKSDVFVFPTFYHYETFGIVNLEAMQHALPIISTPEGGIPDIVLEGETGFLIPQRSHEQLAEKMKIFINHPKKRKTMGQAGRKRYEQLFTLETFEHRLTYILIKASAAGHSA